MFVCYWEYFNRKREGDILERGDFIGVNLRRLEKSSKSIRVIFWGSRVLGGFWGVNNVLFFDLCISYVSVVILWKCIKRYIYVCFFLCVYYMLIKRIF